MELDENLDKIKLRLNAGETVNDVTVRTLLSWFYGSQRRGWWVVEQIQKALDIRGLMTVPDFNSAYIDSHIEFKKKNFATVVDGQKASGTTGKNSEELLTIDDPTYRISRLEAANRELVSVRPDSDLSEAITKMMTFDFSQLPVMQSKRDLKGVISWRSIGQKLAVGKTSSVVRDLMEPSFQMISSETSLFKALPIIIEHDYVLVKNKENEICGIVTASDLSLQFKQLSEPFLLVAEIESHIRQILMKLDQVDLENGKDQRDVERKIESVADLTFGEYLRLFENPVIWSKLRLQIDRNTFCEQLKRIKDVRNNIMHFDPDGLEPMRIDFLRSFVRLLQTLRSLNVF